MSRGNDHGSFDRLSCQGGLDHVCNKDSFDDFIFQIQGFSGLFGQKNGIIPGEFGHGVRPFLHPSVVGVATIIHGAGMNEDGL
jgi:hypothetical protein